ncbi:hypothetical protein [Thermogymnomonas acidicola]|uniref:ribosomal RNA small subunit methyltransferase A n=1 Tax=Thermogymnomonas acidicola TaxID=399579 RepID=UPI00094679B8|nr:rRNA adenine dimethyltransferase family protein [Thermogymnomonas acidicola]
MKQDFLEFQAGGEYDGIIGNIPYHITSQIVFRLPEFRFRRAVIMVQREFAERMVAAPGSRDYSRLSVSVALRFNARIEKIVARKYFRPVPKVDSAIVSLQPRETPVDMAAVEKVIQRAFSMRRKKLGGNIFEGGCPQEYAELRPDQISPEAFLDLASRLTGLSPRGHP